MSPQEIMKLPPEQMEAHADYLAGMSDDQRAVYKAQHGLKDLSGIGVDAITELVNLIRSEKNHKVNGLPDYQITS